MQRCKGTHLYGLFETNVAPVNFCGNTLGSPILIQAHGSASHTHLYRRKYDTGVTDAACSACGGR